MEEEDRGERKKVTEGRKTDKEGEEENMEVSLLDLLRKVKH